MPANRDDVRIRAAAADLGLPLLRLSRVTSLLADIFTGAA